MRSLVVCSLAALGLAGCGQGGGTPSDPQPPWVRTVAVAPVGEAQFGLSGTVRAEVEAPLGFQVPGRIAARLVAAGHVVRAGQPLMRLDERDLLQAEQAATADLAAAEAALATARADLERSRALQQQGFVSTQAVDRAELLLREAVARRDASAARRAQARNALGYAQLTSPAAGVLLDVTGEPGQVVAAGQPVAVLAQGAAREIELFLPETLTPPARGEALLPDGRALPLVLREVAGNVEPLGRTRRARYTVTEGAAALVPGAVVRTRFVVAAPARQGSEATVTALQVPIGALDERGAGARVWRVADGRVAPVDVKVIGMDGERAQISTALPAGTRVVALGTHLLREGMAVRELPR
jgi:RND family efflux transporter MFP subunit